jgi:hypothetical protein
MKTRNSYVLRMAFMITGCVFNKVSLNIEAEEEAIDHRANNTA